jgi:orotidine-5'-phosphate decarboxylase
VPAVGERPGGFAARVAQAVAETGPLCAGIDPSSALLDRWGLPDDPRGLAEFGSRCVEAFAGTVPVVKPQVAFFERFGSAGLAALERLLEWAREAKLLVIADAKRGDIENTMTGYATAWLDPVSPLSADAVTVVPYLGLGALEPMIETAARHERGVLVVVRSSNREGREVQEARTGSGTGPPVEDLLLSEIATSNNGPGARPGTLGAVIGATLAPSAFSLASLGGVVLAPGVGAQGATAADVAAHFSGCAPGTVLPSVSRSLLLAGPDVASLAAAALRARDEMAEALLGPR